MIAQSIDTKYNLAHSNAIDIKIDRCIKKRKNEVEN